MITRDRIRVRDPFVLLCEDTYCLYASDGKTALSCYMSADLRLWEPVGTVFEIPGDFWAYKDVWAGEIHYCQGRYYLFVSLLGRNGRRGTQIAARNRFGYRHGKGRIFRGPAMFFWGCGK